ncbi:MAG TPA: DNA translocase FtsK 4TM domain-containing protein, partial [Candidatus Gracilibacteria bacterium]|nr:DNA translocase FtsK 4TM domain-containing protein [Candidatus Gracilibacteria bacterium]
MIIFWQNGGILGSYLSHIFELIFGIGRWIIPLLAFTIASLLWFHPQTVFSWTRSLSIATIIISLLG